MSAKRTPADEEDRTDISGTFWSAADVVSNTNVAESPCHSL